MCSPDIPDTSAQQDAAIQSQERIANRQFQLQQESLDYFRQRQEGLDALTNKVTERQLAMAEENAAQGRDLYEYQKRVFRPVEESLVSQAMRDSTPEYYEKYAQQAAAQQAASNANAQGQMERTMASMGVNPNSGMFAAQQRNLQLSNAAGLGATMNQARDRAESLSWARRAEVAGLGKGLVGAGNASYGLAQQGNAGAVSSANQTTNTAGNTMGTATQWGQLANQGAAGVANSYNDIYKAQANIAAQNDGGLGALGTLVGAYAAFRR